MSDAKLVRPVDGRWDFTIAANGDIETVDFFDSSILVSLLEEKRATPDEVAEPQLRRGWIGNESLGDFERGSKIWLYYQARLTQEVMNSIINAANESLQHFVDEGFAVAIESDVLLQNGAVVLAIAITRPNNQVERRFFTLWENSGVTRTED